MAIDFQSFLMGVASGSGSGGIQPRGTLEISENGEYDVGEYEKVNVDVEGGIEGGYLVNFISDDELYYMVSCKQGDSITAPPESPISKRPGFSFAGWVDSNHNPVNFPYTPIENTEIVATFSPFNWEVENNGIAVKLADCTYHCINLVAGQGFFGDKDLVAYGKIGEYTGPFLVTKAPRNRCMDRNGGASEYANATKTIVFNGETYYYEHCIGMPGSSYYYDSSGLNRYRFPDNLTIEQAAEDVLTQYFAGVY